MNQRGSSDIVVVGLLTAMIWTRGVGVRGRGRMERSGDFQ